MLFHSCFALFSNILLHRKAPLATSGRTVGEDTGRRWRGAHRRSGRREHRRGEEEHSTVTDLLPPITCHIPSVHLSGRPAVHRDPGPSFIQRVGF